jgi:pimeloyl-ACP methyl ester carboxylesterase
VSVLQPRLRFGPRWGSSNRRVGGHHRPAEGRTFARYWSGCFARIWCASSCSSPESFAETADDLGAVDLRTLVMVTDDDEVTLEHAIRMYHGMPNSELAVVPGTSHGLLVEKPALCNMLVLDFLTNDPVATMAPIRRAAPRL